MSGDGNQNNVTFPIILIGPIGAGKSTQGKLGAGRSALGDG
jgi:hypothetical protein